METIKVQLNNNMCLLNRLAVLLAQYNTCHCLGNFMHRLLEIYLIIVFSEINDFQTIQYAKILWSFPDEPFGFIENNVMPEPH